MLLFTLLGNIKNYTTFEETKFAGTGMLIYIEARPLNEQEIATGLWSFHAFGNINSSARTKRFHACNYKLELTEILFLQIGGG